MKKVLLILIIFSACGGNEVIEEPSTTTTTVKETATTSSSTTTTTLGTTSTSILEDVLPEILITCEPVPSDDEGYMTFKFEVKTGTNEITVLNIVSWFDSARTDDLFFYNDLPEPGYSKEFGYSVDNSFSQYEIEVLVMDSKENFATDYCIYKYTP